MDFCGDFTYMLHVVNFDVSIVAYCIRITLATTASLITVAVQVPVSMFTIKSLDNAFGKAEDGPST